MEADHEGPSLGLIKLAAKVWGAHPDSLARVAIGGNAVYSISISDSPAYLRLTDDRFRSLPEVKGECAFIRYLDQSGLPVSRPLPAQNGDAAVLLDDSTRRWVACMFTEAPGELIGRDHPAWGPDFVRAWGAFLGRLHSLSRGYLPPASARHTDWDEDFWLRRAAQLLPSADQPVHREIAAVFDFMNSLPKTPDWYGMTHGDLGPQNMRYAASSGITVFDFGNCGKHWFLWDVAVALSIFLWEGDPVRSEHRQWLLEGYLAEFDFPEAALEKLDWFLRLRIVYVYLSRLWWFGDSPASSQRKVLARLHDLLLHPVSWNSSAGPSWRD